LELKNGFQLNGSAETGFIVNIIATAKIAPSTGYEYMLQYIVIVSLRSSTIRSFRYTEIRSIIIWIPFWI